MSANSFGQFFKLTTFGESHGEALGAIIEGCPAGVDFNEEILFDMLERRRPGSSKAVSGRNEADKPKILSGVFEGKTLGTPIAIQVENKDARSKDYDKLKDSPRAGHADDVWQEKFGHRDHRGGGRSSGRETLARVLGGAVARMMLETRYPELKVVSTPAQIGPLKNPSQDEIVEFLTQAKSEGQSYGGIGEVKIQNVPKSLGQPVFRKLKADLTSAMMGIGATTGIEIGEGFSAVEAKGTEFHGNEKVYGGIRGGISTGEDIEFRVAFKPTSSVLDVAKQGRHDPCIVLRALVVLEAMTWLVLADHDQWKRLDQV